MPKRREDNEGLSFLSIYGVLQSFRFNMKHLSIVLEGNKSPQEGQGILLQQVIDAQKKGRE
jgi:hypothetical protein